MTRTICLLAGALLACSSVAQITKTERGAVVTTPRLRATFADGVLVALHNRLTDEAYLAGGAHLGETLPHLPAGLGSQGGATPELAEDARQAAAKLYHWPWWEHPNDRHWPNQRFADAESAFRFAAAGPDRATLTYVGLTDGLRRYPEETFTLELVIEPETLDVLVTPGGTSPHPGVYAANLTLAPLAPPITVEAPVADGLRIRREHTGQVLWANQWPSYWQYGFIALNGWQRGAVAIWAQDARLRHYKHLFYLHNRRGLSLALSVMNVPPFEKLTAARPALPWRLQAFAHGWSEAAARYRQWRDAEVRVAPRPEFAQRHSFIASLAGPQEQWLEAFRRYVAPHEGRAAAFLTSVRGQPFDRNHADNTPYEGFAADTARWRQAGTYGMAYLQPMILWGPFRPEDERSEREARAIALHRQADTRSVFQPDPDTVVRFVDQHHLGHPGWQRWMLDWVHGYCQDYGAQGIYHDQSYHAPIDRRGLAVGDKTSPEGMADYFYRAATENPGTFHGTELVTEANAVGASNAIGSGYHWGTTPHMRLARVYAASPVTAALAHPHTVLWSFVRLRGDSTWDLRERRMQEARAQIAGAIDGPFAPNFDARWWPALANTAWHDRTRDTTFLKYGLRPTFPTAFDRDTFSYFQGAEGEDFRYERTPWGSRFVQVVGEQRRLLYGVATGVQAVPLADAGIEGWLVYNDARDDHTWNRPGPAGLHPERWYVLDPNVRRPGLRFATDNPYGHSFYEAHVADSAYNAYVACLRLRPIEQLTPVIGWERLVLHSPEPPHRICVDGKPVPLQPKPGVEGQYLLSVKAPADIVVYRQRPPAELAKSALLRITEAQRPVDYFRPALLADQADGGQDDAGRQVLHDAAAAPLGYQFGGRKHLLVPLATPPDSAGGKWRVHLAPRKQHGRQWNHLIESVAVDFRPVARAPEPDLAGVEQPGLPPFIDVALAPGDCRLLTVRTIPLKGRHAPDLTRVTTELTCEWLEAEETAP